MAIIRLKEALILQDRKTEKNPKTVQSDALPYTLMSRFCINLILFIFPNAQI